MTIITDQKIEINSNFEEHVKAAAVLIEGKKININYKNWKADKIPSQVYRIPYEFCRFRLENGRISIDVSSEEATKSILKADNPDHQIIIASYLKRNSKNETLKGLLQKDGQTDPAVITADGFLINGNRRRLILEELYNKKFEDRFKTIEVVILPGSKSPERPSLEDIAMLEYREQVQSDGKSEYSDMAKALTIRNNIRNGLPLIKMMKDNPQYSSLSERAFEADRKKLERDTVGVLKEVDEYLKAHKTIGNYRMVESKWDSFRELNQKVLSKLDDANYLSKHNIEEDQIGEVVEACHTIMKLKNPKIINKDRHTGFIRQINNWISNAKEEFLELSEIPEIGDHITDPKEREREWEIERSELAENIVKKVNALSLKKKDQDGPIKKLEAILSMLDHKFLEDEKIHKMLIDELDTAIRLTNSIQTENKKLQQTFYDLKENKSPKALKKFFEKR